MSDKETLLLTGASGHVGSRLRTYLDVIAPTHRQLDITQINQVRAYFIRLKPTVVIHAAAYTGVKKAERERGDKKGICWKVNVVGTQNIDRAAREVGAFLIFISTGSVFAGSKTNPGPFKEDDKPSRLMPQLTWYGYTKREAEKVAHGAVVRISHPLYAQRLVDLWRRDQTHEFPIDDRFPLTSVRDLAKAIGMLTKKRLPGIYHVASPDLTSAYEIVASRVMGPVRATHRPQYYAIDSTKTQKILGFKFKPWKEVVRERATSFFRE